VLDKKPTEVGSIFLFVLPSLGLVASYFEQFSGYFDHKLFPVIRFSGDDSLYFRHVVERRVMEDNRENTGREEMQIEMGSLELLMMNLSDSSPNYQAFL
jgi:hypothetical protein